MRVRCYNWNWKYLKCQILLPCPCGVLIGNSFPYRCLLLLLLATNKRKWFVEVICFKFENRRTIQITLLPWLVSMRLLNNGERERYKSMIFCSLVWKDNRAAHAAGFLMRFFDVVCKTTTWMFHFWCSDDKASRSFYS